MSRQKSGDGVSMHTQLPVNARTFDAHQTANIRAGPPRCPLRTIRAKTIIRVFRDFGQFWVRELLLLLLLPESHFFCPTNLNSPTFYNHQLRSRVRNFSQLTEDNLTEACLPRGIKI